MSEPEAGHPVDVRAEQPKAARPPGFVTITAVLVEDDPAAREGLTRLLTAAGVQVLAAAATVAEGHRTIAELRPDVAVIDSHLPDGLGVNLCHTITAQTPSVAVVIHSGLVTGRDEREARRVGAAAVVAKTIRGDELLDAIRTVSIRSGR